MALTPTPVTLQNLVDETALINLFNDGIETQLVSPRTDSPQVVAVQVTDDPRAPTFASGTCDTNTANHAIDATYNFEALGVVAGDSVIATVSGLSSLVVSVSGSDITMAADICPAGSEAFTVIKPSYWVQKLGFGEWKRSNAKTGNNKRATYTLPVTGTVSTIVVHDVVYPVATPEDTGFYPPATNA